MFADRQISGHRKYNAIRVPVCRNLTKHRSKSERYLVLLLNNAFNTVYRFYHLFIISFSRSIVRILDLVIRNN